MDYYDLKKNWRKVKPFLADAEVQAALVRDFNKFTMGRWRQRFLPGMTPRQFESCDWDYDHVGPRPAYWDYVKHAACHWICNFTLRLAERVEPDRKWRILTSVEHSTVWDGKLLLFDFNLQAMGITAGECFRMANKKRLKPGALLTVYLADHYSHDERRIGAGGVGGGV